MSAGPIIPTDMFEAAHAELDRLRTSLRRGPGKQTVYLGNPEGDQRIDSLLIMLLVIEMRELRRFVVGAFTEPAVDQAAPAPACEHPMQLRVDESRMGQEPGAEFFCPVCEQHITKDGNA